MKIKAKTYCLELKREEVVALVKLLGSTCPEERIQKCNLTEAEDDLLGEIYMKFVPNSETNENAFNRFIRENK